MLIVVVLASARGSSRAVCLPPGNWGSSHLKSCQSDHRLGRYKWLMTKRGPNAVQGRKGLSQFLRVRSPARDQLCPTDEIVCFPISISTYSHVKNSGFFLQTWCFFSISRIPSIPIRKSELVLK